MAFYVFLAQSPPLVRPEVEQHSLPPTPIVGVDYPDDLAVARSRLAATAASPAAAAAAPRGRRRAEGGPEGEATRRALSHPVNQEGVARAAVVRRDEMLHLGTNVLPPVLNLPQKSKLIPN